MDANWWKAWAPKLSAYAILIRLLIDQRISAREFEALFLQLYQDDPTDWPVNVLDVLENLFADVDEFSTAQAARPASTERVEHLLRSRASEAFTRLSELAPAIG